MTYKGAARKLYHAGRRVVDNWETGELAEAVRELDQVLKETGCLEPEKTELESSPPDPPDGVNVELIEALSACLSTLTDERLGTVDYMEGSDIYDDFEKTVSTVREALAKAKKATI